MKLSFKDITFIVLGVLSATLGLKGFLLPNSFLDGGVTGISLIVTELTQIPLSLLIILINLPFLLLSIKTIGKVFFFKSVLSIVLLAISLAVLNIPILTDESLLIAFFGGFFLGLGIGLTIRGGGVLDGTEVLAVYIAKKTPLTIGDIILIFNLIIFIFAAYVFSIEIALYAILTYLAASKTVDYVVDGIEEYVGIKIISDSYEEIRKMIISELGRGCTIFLGEKGMAGDYGLLSDTKIVFTLITRLELTKLQKEIDKIDKNAFVIIEKVHDAKGGMVKKKPLSH